MASGDGEAERLLGDDVLAGPQALQRQRRVRVVRRDDRHEVHVAVPQHLPHVAKSADRGKVDLRGRRSLRVQLAHRCRLQSRRRHPARVRLAHVERAAVANHAAADRFTFRHSVLLMNTVFRINTKTRRHEADWKGNNLHGQMQPCETCMQTGTPRQEAAIPSAVNLRFFASSCSTVDVALPPH